MSGFHKLHLIFVNLFHLPGLHFFFFFHFFLCKLFTLTELCEHVKWSSFIAHSCMNKMSFCIQIIEFRTKKKKRPKINFKIAILFYRLKPEVKGNRLCCCFSEYLKVCVGTLELEPDPLSASLGHSHWFFHQICVWKAHHMRKHMLSATRVTVTGKICQQIPQG